MEHHKAELLKKGALQKRKIHQRTDKQEVLLRNTGPFRTFQIQALPRTSGSRKKNDLSRSSHTDYRQPHAATRTSAVTVRGKHLILSEEALLRNNKRHSGRKEREKKAKVGGKRRAATRNDPPALKQ